MIEHAGISEQGNVRFRNEDFIAHRLAEEDGAEGRKGSLFVIADGVGGRNAGDVASREAGRTLLERYYTGSAWPERALQNALRQANLHIYDLAMREGRLKMETTLSAIALAGGQAFIAHVGDSRIYRVRGENNIVQLTRDHSEVAELVRMQILTPENARHHPRRHIITRSVGSEPIVRPLFRTEPVVAGDTFLMCTDGLWEPLDDAEIAQIVARHPPEEACRRLIALGMERQSTDNLSVQIIKVIAVNQENSGRTSNEGDWQSRLSQFWERLTRKPKD